MHIHKWIAETARVDRYDRVSFVGTFAFRLTRPRPRWALRLPGSDAPGSTTPPIDDCLLSRLCWIEELRTKNGNNYAAVRCMHPRARAEHDLSSFRLSPTARFLRRWHLRTVYCCRDYGSAAMVPAASAARTTQRAGRVRLRSGGPVADPGPDPGPRAVRLLRAGRGSPVPYRRGAAGVATMVAMDVGGRGPGGSIGVNSEFEARA